MLRVLTRVILRCVYALAHATHTLCMLSACAAHAKNTRAHTLRMLSIRELTRVILRGKPHVLWKRRAFTNSVPREFAMPLGPEHKAAYTSSLRPHTLAAYGRIH